MTPPVEVSEASALPEELDALLRAWLPAQRWFPAKGQEFTLTDVGQVELPSGEAGVRIEHRLLGVTVRDGTQVVQVPLVFRADTAARTDTGSADAVPGALGTLGASSELVVDGPQDPAYVRALLGLLAEQQVHRGTATAAGHQSPGAAHDPAAPGKVLSGEQSNTSIIIASESNPLMVKLFRVINDGPNPDVEVTSALSQAGVTAVAKVAGWVDGSWTSPDGAPANGHLAVSAEFLAGSQDAWREAVEAVRSNADFTASAMQLGRATAEVHAALASALGTTPATEEQVDSLISQLRGRIEWALREVPQLKDKEGRLLAHAASLSSLTAADIGTLQRIHGDYHLGQVLHSPTRGWILLDFEGEPLRPLAQRILPDVPLRDVVGMLRSFDYAAGFVTVEDPDLAHQNRAWANACTTSFLAGYREVAGSTGGQPNAQPGAQLFDALLLDKALYEVVYEARNRPDWNPIPLGAVTRVLEA